MELYDQAYDLLCDGKTDEAIAAYKLCWRATLPMSKRCMT